jgi:hypothetical protein
LGSTLDYVEWCNCKGSNFHRSDIGLIEELVVRGNLHLTTEMGGHYKEFLWCPKAEGNVLRVFFIFES